MLAGLCSQWLPRPLQHQIKPVHQHLSPAAISLHQPGFSDQTDTIADLAGASMFLRLQGKCNVSMNGIIRSDLEPETCITVLPHWRAYVQHLSAYTGTASMMKFGSNTSSCTKLTVHLPTNWYSNPATIPTQYIRQQHAPEEKAQGSHSCRRCST